MGGKRFALPALLITAAWLSPVEPAAAEDPRNLGPERGRRIAEVLRAQGAFCLRATTLKRTIVRLDGERTYRVACGPDGGPPIYLITLPPGQRLGRS